MRSIGVATPLTLVLLGFLGFIACTREPVTQDNKNVSTETASSALASAECQGTHAQRLAKLKLKYENSNTDTGDQHLNDQWKRNDVNISISDDPVLGIGMHIRGSITGHDSPRKLSKLMKFFEKDLDKGCIQRVSFESMSSAAGFAWTICNDPERPCPPPDGACAMCAMNTGANVTPSPTPNANVNVNMPANPNTNGSSNTNSEP